MSTDLEPLEPLEPDELDDAETERPGSRWSWVFWLLLAASATPLALSVAAAQRVLTTPDVVEEASDLQRPPGVFADRWGTLLTYDPLSWPTAISAFTLLVLAAVVASGRPEWLVVARRRLAVGALAAGCALWGLATTAVSAWAEFRGPTARQQDGDAQGYLRVVPLQWLPAAGLTLLAAVVALVALGLCLATRPRRASVDVTPTD